MQMDKTGKNDKSECNGIGPSYTDVLPDMIDRGGGKIMNVASTAAFQPGPTMSVYFATKAFVLSFSEAISEEVRDKGITVTALCPGSTETGFHAVVMGNKDLLKERRNHLLLR